MEPDGPTNATPRTEINNMCDYSLGGLKNRLGVDGEELIVHRFSTHSMGLASPAELETAMAAGQAAQHGFWRRIQMFFNPQLNPEPPAVCVPPGANLIVKSMPADLQTKWGARNEESVFFIQTTADENQYRDALQFRNGRQVLLQDLREGMRLILVSLGSDSTTGEEELLFASRPRTS
jgi:hypothetical protein